MAAALMAVPAGGAAAQDRLTDLTFTRDEPDHPVRTVTLGCDPDSGSHPNIAAACRYLAADGDLVLPEENPDVHCIRYHPVSLHVIGTLNGRPVSAHRTYGCVVPDLPAPWQF
ncbi:SSI family serine proteinase inhibitor [Nocardia aurantia]|nr:SSI family serine proteinase inhibitor [Nocardia aurantia]